jgi:hypothetical protein
MEVTVRASIESVVPRVTSTRKNGMAEEAKESKVRE